jgi:protocatechuate 3,4-dioxygenase beta subunit
MGDPQQFDRREALAIIGGLGVALVAIACGSGSSDSASTSTTAAGSTTGGTSCALAAEATQGPFFLTDHPKTSNLVGDRKGTPLQLTMTVVDAACRPISDAKVDIWHCDAAGEYGGISGGGAGGAPPPGGGVGGSAATRGNKDMWLQGYQTTGAGGTVKFSTIYPGWYPGRAVHIHLKVYVGGRDVHTGQLFFPDQLSAAVFKNAPYKGNPDTVNSHDFIFSSAGSAALLTPTQSGSAYVATAQLVVKT